MGLRDRIRNCNLSVTKWNCHIRIPCALLGLLLMFEVLSEVWLLACSDPICTRWREVTSALSFVLSSVVVVTDDRTCCCQPQDRTQMQTLHKLKKERWCSNHKLVWLSGVFSCWQRKAWYLMRLCSTWPPVFSVPSSNLILIFVSFVHKDYWRCD